MKPVRLAFPLSSSTLPVWLVGHGTARTAAAIAASALSIAVGFAAVVTWQTWNAKNQLTALHAELQASRTAPVQRSKRSADTKPLLGPQQALAWNQLVRQLNTPWSALLDALEAATPEDVALVSIEPDGRQGSIRLQVEARTLDGLLAYAGTLKSIERFDQVTLVKHETNDQDATRPLRLSLDIRLKLKERVQ